MSDFKADQDRFFDRLRDLADFADAAERDRSQAYKAQIDKATTLWVEGGLYETEAEAREEIIRRLKERRKLPANYIYPEEP